MNRKFQCDSARFANSFADALGQHQMMAVARRQVRPGLRDADDRLARAQLVEAEPEIQIAFEIQRRHVDILAIREPGAAAQLRGDRRRSEEHTSELQSLMRISYAVFCLKTKTETQH